MTDNNNLDEPMNQIDFIEIAKMLGDSQEQVLQHYQHLLNDKDVNGKERETKVALGDKGLLLKVERTEPQ